MGYVLFYLGIFLAAFCLFSYRELKEQNWLGYDMFDAEITICCFIAAFFFIFLSWNGLNMLITAA